MDWYRERVPGWWFEFSGKVQGMMGDVLLGDDLGVLCGELFGCSVERVREVMRRGMRFGEWEGVKRSPMVIVPPEPERVKLGTHPADPAGSLGEVETDCYFGEPLKDEEVKEVIGKAVEKLSDGEVRVLSEVVGIRKPMSSAERSRLYRARRAGK